MEARFSVLNMAEAPFLQQQFRLLEPIAEVTHRRPDRQVLAACLADYDAYFCSLAVRVDRSMLAAAGRLKVIVTASTGLDHIDTDEAAARGIEVISLRGDGEFLKQVTATAEMAWGLLLAVVRHIPWSFGSVLQGQWQRDRFRGSQLGGKTLGVLGYGRLGSMVAEYGRAFGMNVIVCEQREIDTEPFRKVDFRTLLQQSDVLSIHIHLTDENRHLLDRQAFSRMKEGSVLINTSRGAIVDEQALLEALRSGKVAAAGLDVIDGEWRDDLGGHPLIAYAREHSNLLLSPHTGGATWESQRLAYDHSIQKLYSYLLHLKERGRRTHGLEKQICDDS